jgi:hypothetical protein
MQTRNRSTIRAAADLDLCRRCNAGNVANIRNLKP